MHRKILPPEYNHYISTLFPQYHQFNDLMVRTARENLPINGHVPCLVNLGCGTGNLEERFLTQERREVRLIGIDHETSSLDYARERLGSKVELVRAEIPDLDFPKADIYLASLTLHHLNGNWQESFEKIASALPRGGLFLQLEMHQAKEGSTQQKYWQYLRKNLEPDYSFDEWMQESQKVDHFRTLEEEIALISQLGMNPEVIAREGPFSLYLARKTRT
ncbi:MAG: class I SAM-dependent methyltransferase [Candidatus Woesearchaeota archaeon]|jgi:ubiquinone/menaquinone biosynthesis C-methylase UbiE